MELELRGITKRFGSLVANDHIDLRVAPGEIRGLLGENGAGKTTLMNVLYGLVQPDEGEILLDGRPVAIHSPRDAINAKIGMVHQHFMLVPVFTVAENVALGRRANAQASDRPGFPTGLLDRGRARRQVQELSERYGLAGQPGRAGRGPAGRRAAAGGDHQGAAAPGQRADPGRADRRADPERDRGPVPGHARAAGRRPVHRLHLAQAQGSPGHRRRDHRHPARAGSSASGRRAPATPSWPR